MESSKIEHLSTKIKLKRRSGDMQITNDYIEKNGSDKMHDTKRLTFNNC